jgi:hypothetical protein
VPCQIPQGKSDLQGVASEFSAHCRLSFVTVDPLTIQEHEFLRRDSNRKVDMVGWIARALEYRAKTENKLAATSV